MLVRGSKLNIQRIAFSARGRQASLSHKVASPMFEFGVYLHCKLFRVRIEHSTLMLSRTSFKPTNNNGLLVRFSFAF